MNTNIAMQLAPRTWRTQESHEQYLHERSVQIVTDECPFCVEEPIEKFDFWFILPNKYPYDAVAHQHDLLLPYRHVGNFNQLNEAELTELHNLKSGCLNANYNYMLEAMPKNKSIPGHFHFHLIYAKVIG